MRPSSRRYLRHRRRPHPRVPGQPADIARGAGARLAAGDPVRRRLALSRPAGHLPPARVGPFRAALADRGDGRARASRLPGSSTGRLRRECASSASSTTTGRWAATSPMGCASSAIRAPCGRSRRQHDVSTIVVVPQAVSWESYRDLLELASGRDGIRMKLAPGLQHLVTTGAEMTDSGFLPLISIQPLRITRPRRADEAGARLSGVAAAAAVAGALRRALLAGSPHRRRRAALRARSRCWAGNRSASRC